MNWFRTAQKNNNINNSWFQNSKVVNETGEPLIVYHGTKGTFTLFENRYQQKNYGTAYSDGFYFTPIKNTAQNYAKLVGGNRVIEAYLRINNPLIVNSVADYKKFIWKIKNEGNVIEKDRKLGKKDSQLLSELGYDGIIGKNEIVVFDSSQIKIIS